MSTIEYQANGLPREVWADTELQADAAQDMARSLLRDLKREGYGKPQVWLNGKLIRSEKEEIIMERGTNTPGAVAIESTASRPAEPAQEPQAPKVDPKPQPKAKRPEKRAQATKTAARVHLGIRIEQEIIEKLNARARDEERSVSAVVRLLLKQALK